MALPEGTAERIAGWAEGEEANIQERQELVDELSAAMGARGYDTEAVKAVVDG